MPPRVLLGGTVDILQHIKQLLRTHWGRGEGRNPDPKLAALLARNAQKLAQQQREARKLENKEKAGKKTQEKVVPMRTTR